MMRIAIRGATILLAALASAAAMLAAPLPASAATALHLCETYGGQWCVATANLNIGTSLGEGATGRLFIESRQGAGTYLGYPTYKLKFNADDTKCAGADSNLNLEIRDCTADGNVWARVNDGDNIYRWINKYASEHPPTYCGPCYLTGFDLGVSFELRAYPPPPQSGQLQRFSWIA
jgi:hypothetical protein